MKRHNGIQMHISKWKKPIWNGNILNDSNYMILWKRQKYGKSKHIRGYQGLEEKEGWIGRAILYYTIMVDASHYAFVQTHRTYNTKSDSSCNYGLWVIMMCPCKFLDCNKCTVVVWDVDSWRGCACVGTLCTFRSILLQTLKVVWSQHR